LEIAKKDTIMKNTFRFFGLFIFSLLLCSCGDSGVFQEKIKEAILTVESLFGSVDGLSKTKAEEIIKEHFSESYSFCIPKKAAFTYEPPKGHKFILTAKKLGLVDVKQVSAMFGQYGMNSRIEKPNSGDVFSIELSDKGKSVSNVENTNGDICFLTSQRIINDIIEIQSTQDNQYTILFSYIREFNEFGHQSLLDLQPTLNAKSFENSKFRGKATIVYDAFLKEFVLRNVLYSNWDKEVWHPAWWIANIKDKKVVVYGQ